jgi:hypothetical protein
MKQNTLIWAKYYGLTVEEVDGVRSLVFTSPLNTKSKKYLDLTLPYYTWVTEELLNKILSQILKQEELIEEEKETDGANEKKF